MTWTRAGGSTESRTTDRGARTLPGPFPDPGFSVVPYASSALLALSLLLPQNGAADPAALAALAKNARAADYKTRLDAYEALVALGDVGKRTLEPILRDAEAKAARDFLASAKAPAAAAHRKWLKGEIEAARKEALKVIQDTKIYPDDAHGAVGQPIVDGAVGKVRDLWLRPGRTYREKNPTVDEKLYFVKEAADWLARAGFEPNTFENLAAAKDRLDEEFDVIGIFYPGTKRKELDELYEYNDTYPGTATDEERRYARILNDYRVMLGLEPLELDERLVIAARKHSQEMQDMNYFAHESPVEENRSPGQRAAKEGFHGGVLENCAISGDAQDAFNGWYTSSGHHRGLISSGSRQLGIGQSTGGGHWTMMAGSSDSLRKKGKKGEPRTILATRKAKLRAGDAETRFRLAKFCFKNGLDVEGRQLLEEVVELEPLHRFAHEMLGHVISNGRWVTAEQKLAEDVVGKPEAAAVDAVAAALANERAAVRLAAVNVVREKKFASAVSNLIGALKDEASEVRIAAADGLREFNATQAVGALKPLLSDGVFYVRHAAAEALFKLGDSSGIPVLFSGLRSGDLNVRLDAHRRAKSVTGQDFGYAWDLPDVERAKVVDQWEAWWRDEGSKK